MPNMPFAQFSPYSDFVVDLEGHDVSLTVPVWKQFQEYLGRLYDVDPQLRNLFTAVSLYPTNEYRRAELRNYIIRLFKRWDESFAELYMH